MKTKLCAHLIDSFNGCLSSQEQQAFEAHLTDCQSCREEWAELQELTDYMAYSAESVEPDKEMKERVLAAVFAEEPLMDKGGIMPKRPKRPLFNKWLQPVLAALLLLSVGANVYFLTEKTASHQEAVASAVRNMNLAASEGFSATAEATIIQENEAASLVIQAHQLQAVSGQEAYQVWLIDESGEKVRAGTFRPTEQGNGAVTYLLSQLPEKEWAMIAITLEPTAKSAEPLGDIVLAAEM